MDESQILYFLFERNKLFTKAEKIDADTPGTGEDDDSGEGWKDQPDDVAIFLSTYISINVSKREDQPARVATEEDDAVPEPRHVHLVRKPGKTCQKKVGVRKNGGMGGCLRRLAWRWRSEDNEDNDKDYNNHDNKENDNEDNA